MIYVFCIGLICVALALPVRSDGPILSRSGVRRRLLQSGLALCSLAIVLGDFHAGGVSALLVTGVVLAGAAGLLFWLDRGRFDTNHTRRTLAWYVTQCGPGGTPMGGHRMMALVTAALLLGLLVLRPVVRDVLGLDADGIEAAMILRGMA
ncbi:hypothetical protein [Gymnodinialimonas ulvae]|uniref:hypothetical protein n=1 Tax=Gymnodinialimonas ulvae TaxID=3126504 RepID=UPI0030B55DD8